MDQVILKHKKVAVIMVDMDMMALKELTVEQVMKVVSLQNKVGQVLLVDSVVSHVQIVRLVPLLLLVLHHLSQHKPDQLRLVNQVF